VLCWAAYESQEILRFFGTWVTEPLFELLEFGSQRGYGLLHVCVSLNGAINTSTRLQATEVLACSISMMKWSCTFCISDTSELVDTTSEFSPVLLVRKSWPFNSSSLVYGVGSECSFSTFLKALDRGLDCLWERFFRKHISRYWC
jgi:hypothetical protein